MLTPEAIEELSKLEASATVGPWKLDMGNWTIETENEEFYRAEICGIDWSSRNNLLDDHPNPVHPYSDGEFIVAIRNAAKKLIEYRKRDWKWEYENQCKFTESFENRFDELVVTARALEAKLEKAKECMVNVRSELTHSGKNIDEHWCVEQICQTIKEIS